MTVLQAFRDGYSPAWKSLWVSVWNLICAIGGLIAVIGTFVAYSRGDMQHAIFFAIMVLWAASAERGSSNG